MRENSILNAAKKKIQAKENCETQVIQRTAVCVKKIKLFLFIGYEGGMPEKKTETDTLPQII